MMGRGAEWSEYNLKKIMSVIFYMWNQFQKENSDLDVGHVEEAMNSPQ